MCIVCLFYFYNFHASQAAAELSGEHPASRQSRLANPMYPCPHPGEDQLRGILSKQNNESYKPWKNQFAPPNPHSPFGDFPKEYIPREKLKETKHEPDH